MAFTFTPRRLSCEGSGRMAGHAASLLVGSQSRSHTALCSYVLFVFLSHVRPCVLFAFMLFE